VAALLAWIYLRGRMARAAEGRRAA